MTDITKEVIEDAVNRFLSWKLPKGFAPDCGISFDGRKDDEWNKNKTWPTGTNLFDYSQAYEMFEYALQDALQRQREVSAVPDGWRLVPIEPTVDMINAAAKNETRVVIREGNYPSFTSTYKAMLSASPTKQKEGE